MRVTRCLPLLIALFSCISPAAAADAPPAAEWDTVLDAIHTVTWRGNADIAAEIKKEEARIRQDLPAYIAAWEKRMAVPILYPGKREGDGCGPQNFCAPDVRNARQLLVRLKEGKRPLDRLLYEKLSPETRKAAGDLLLASPPPATTPEREVQLVVADLSRVAAAENLYSDQAFDGIRLSYPARNLVQEHNDSANRVCVNKTLLAEAFPEELARNFKCDVLKDEAYRRVVAARTVQYLRTGNRKTLQEAIALTGRFEDKLMYTDFAFWYHYPRTLADVHDGDAASLVRDAYGYLNDVVLWGEGTAGGAPSPTEEKRRHHTLTIADVILTRAIITARMDGLEGLGSAVWLLGYRSDASMKSIREQELSRLLADLRPLQAGPESDNFRLNYAVALREGRRLQALLVKALDAGEKGGVPEKLFAEAREYAELAYQWAGTWQGKTIAAANCLEVVNLGLTRMKAILPPDAYAALVATPGKADAAAAVLLFTKIAEKDKGAAWQQLRFIDRKSFVDGGQRLWNALRLNSILVGEYYLQKMDRDDFQSVMENADPAEKALVRYKELFESMTAGGQREVVPDSAYFAYGESLRMLSRLKQAVYAYNSSIELHNQSLTHLLKAISVYPYDDALSEYAEISKRINTNFVTMSPESILSNVLANDAVSRCLDSTSAYCDKSVKKNLEWNAYKIKNRLSGGRKGDVAEELKGLLKSWREEVPVVAGGTAGTKVTPPRKGKGSGEGPSAHGLEGERGVLLKLAERYLATTDTVAAEAAAAYEELGRCTAAGVPCRTVTEKAERLLQRKTELDRAREELSARCISFAAAMKGAPAGTAGEKEADYVAALHAGVDDLYVARVDRLLGVGMRKKLYELRMNEGDTLHKVVRSAFYANR